MLAAVAFLPALGAGFVNWDDEAMLLMNAEWRGLGPARLIWMFTTGFFGHWSPLVWITWGANYVVGGLHPFGYHLVNLALHALTVSLFYLVARRLLNAALGNGGESASRASVAAGALAAALLFGVHPLRVESVAWVSERRDLCCGVFYMLAVLAYLRGVSGGGLVAGRWRALSLLAFAAALMCKAIAFTLPLSLLVLDVFPLRRQALGRGPLLREKVPHALLAGAAAAVAFLVRQTGGDITDYERHGVGARLAVMAYGLWFPVWKLVWPTGLSPMYEMPPQIEALQWRFVGPALALLGVTAILIVLRRRWPGALAAWTHSAIVLLPISGLVHSGVQLAHDRYSYLSGLGFAILAGGVLARLVLRAQADRERRAPAALAVAGATLVLLGLGAGTWAQSRVWRDSVTLWRHGRALDSACAVCESNLGRALAESGRIVEGEEHVRRAMELRPDRIGPIENLGVIMLARGRHADGEEYFRRVVARRPESGRLRNMLAVAMANQGRYEDAAAELERARRLSPRLAEAHANLGLLRFRQGRPMDALPLLRQALAIDPGHAGARATMARVLRTRAVELVREGHGDQAAQLWGQAGTLAGDDPPLLRALGQALVERGKGVEAIPVLERAVALDPRSAQDRFWLARAYRLAGRVVDAEREAIALRKLSPELAAELSR